MKRLSRLDEALVKMGHAESLASAKALIMSGNVIVDEQRQDKPGFMISEHAEVRIKGQSRFVSRGGEKLFAAITDLSLENEFNGKVVLDIGASTGGFTDCVLQMGATKSIALDVGTAQLDWRLRQDPRVVSIEKTDIKDFSPTGLPDIDWVVADVSFTSLAKLIPSIRKSAPKARLLLLIKPQFELPRDRIPDGGVVTSEADRRHAVEIVKNALLKEGYNVVESLDAKVIGRQGNREIFILAN